MYLQALLNLLGPMGTIAVPTFNFAFARGEDFDPETTPSLDMGVFSEFVRTRPDAKRTYHPMQSMAILGLHAEELARRDTPSAFDDDSAFGGMLNLGFKLLLLGAQVQAASLVHYSEQRAAVPYRYWKEFKGRVRVSGQWENRVYKMYARDLEMDPELILAPIREELIAQDKWAEKEVNFGAISLCAFSDFIVTTDELLAEDPWALVGNRAEIKLG